MKKTCTYLKSLDNSLSAEAVGNNEDLVREIFLGLPIRSLFRFKLVSKHWFSLFSNPQFTRDRIQRVNPCDVTPSGLFLYNSLLKTEEIESISLDDSPNHLSRVRVPSLSFLETVSGKSKIEILQSCNGLLLCGFVSQSRNEYIVCNPTTRTHKLLPPINLEEATQFTLVFDPSRSPHYRVFYLPLVDIYWSEYSSETGKWSTPGYERLNGLEQIARYTRRSGFYWNGSIYWIQLGRAHRYDLENRNLEELDMPHKPQSYSYRTIKYVGECRGHLHLIYVRRYCSKKILVWGRDREKLKWRVKYSVKTCDLLSKFPEICVKQRSGREEYVYTILSVNKGEKKQDSSMVLNIPGKVISYNFHSKTSKVLFELPLHGTNSLPYHYRTTFNFIESLVSV